MNKSDRKEFYPAVKARAKELRRYLTPAESLLWNALRNRHSQELKFRRQSPIGPYIVDFYCPQHRLVIEIDGDIHLAQEIEDATRTRRLSDYGYRVIRFSNEDVENHLQQVINAILAACEEY